MFGGSTDSADKVTSEEQKPLEDFFEAKGLRTKNEMTEDVRGFLITFQLQSLKFYSPVP